MRFLRESMSIGLGQHLTPLETRRIRRRRDEKFTCELPNDFIIEILMRLPRRSLMRFKCVSKQWSSLIFSRYFCNSLFNITRQKQQQPRLYMFLVNKENKKRALLSASSTFIDKTTCLMVDQNLSIPGMGRFFLNGVRGLMCFSVREKACIYNPSTKQLLTLPEIKPDMKGQKMYNRYYLGHDPISDQYKLLCTIVASDGRLICKSEHWVFVLEAGGLWKKVVRPEYYHYHAPISKGWFTSGSVVHYMAEVNWWYGVVSLDVRSEELTILNVPVEGYLIRHCGGIAIFHLDKFISGDKGFADLWVLEDVGGKKWSTKRMVLEPSQWNLVSGTKLTVKGTTQDDKVILAPLEMCSSFYILCYDMQSNDLRKVEIKGIPQHWFNQKCCLDLKFIDESERFVYLET